MGIAMSTRAGRSLNSSLPKADYIDEDGCRDGPGFFSKRGDKHRFMETLLAVMSENGTYNLRDLRFELSYSERITADGKVRFRAEVTAREGKHARHSLQGGYAASEKLAFEALRAKVEGKYVLAREGGMELKAWKGGKARK